MVKTNPTQLIIIIDHNDPKAVLQMLQKGIIESLQDSFLDRKKHLEIDPDLQQAHYILLEILKATLFKVPE